VDIREVATLSSAHFLVAVAISATFSTNSPFPYRGVAMVAACAGVATPELSRAALAASQWTPNRRRLGNDYPMLC
jgi:hypothetical protein